jgi:hypothetical protein
MTHKSLVNFKRFKQHLWDSTPDVFLVGHHLHRQGFDISIPGLRIAPDISQVKSFQDLGDIFINLHQKRYIVEVKANNKSDFTCTRPHIYSHFLVCAKHAFEKYKNEKPSYYFILNKSRTHVAIINVRKTFSSWSILNTYDARYIDYPQDRYACPANLVKIEKLL